MWWTAARGLRRGACFSPPSPAERRTAFAWTSTGTCGWVGMGSEALDGVNIFNNEAKLIGRIDLPERCANVCFGGVHRNRLFMAASTSVYSLYVNAQGVAGG